MIAKSNKSRFSNAVSGLLERIERMEHNPLNLFPKSADSILSKKS